VNIQGDVRLLGFRYVGKRSKDMDLNKVLTAEQKERELQYQVFYDAPLIKQTGSWF